MTGALLKRLTDTLTWHDRETWERINTSLERFFREYRNELTEVERYAQVLASRMAEVSPFIQLNTGAVCPGCEKVCCVNRHGYYDHEDLIYVYAVGLRHPGYREGLEDTDPCQFLSGTGCTLERPVRPFRCNWYFCTSLLAHMEDGPARPYREFISRFQEIVGARRRMLEAFAAKVAPLACQKEGSTSL
jgi:hypothetical protein